MYFAYLSHPRRARNLAFTIKSGLGSRHVSISRLGVFFTRALLFLISLSKLIWLCLKKKKKSETPG